MRYVKIIEIEDGTIQEYKGNYSNYRKQKERERIQNKQNMSNMYKKKSFRAVHFTKSNVLLA